METTGPRLDITYWLLAIAATALQLVAGFYAAFSLLLVPTWDVAVLVAAWIATIIWVIQRWGTHRLPDVATFGAIAALWITLLLFREALFGFRV